MEIKTNNCKSFLNILKQTISRLMPVFLPIFLMLFLINVAPVSAEKETASGVTTNETKSETVLLFFWSNGCHHCAEEKPFLEKLAKKYPSLTIRHFEISKKENAQLFREVGQALEADIDGIPFTVVGDQYFIGWRSEETTGVVIENAVKENLAIDSKSESASVKPTPTESVATEQKPQKENLNLEEIPKTVNLPLLGEIEIKNFSLLTITIIFGALDGFNPCAMWALLFLISLLLGMKDKKRMWIFGSTFIAISGIVYFLFMTAWLNLILFIGLILWARIIIGLIALGGGAYNLKEFFYNKEGQCKVTGSEKKQQFFSKLKKVTQKKQFWLALGGIIILAVTVNLVEMVCSAGLPVIYTQTLALSHLARWQYCLYLCLYTFIFILDDLFIFFTAMITLQMTGIATKYTRASRLIGGLLMIIIGILLIFKPSLLMFG
ncbi:MAG: thioredoxin family protein [Patescibacteria group bacterium]|nr:thioredoxin family protein [Patescibacteria group bacterium]